MGGSIGTVVGVEGTKAGVGEGTSRIQTLSGTVPTPVRKLQ